MWREVWGGWESVGGGVEKGVGVWGSKGRCGERCREV